MSALSILGFGLSFVVGTNNALAATYYIDFSAGADSQNGTSKSTSWKHNPYMSGWTGSYSHTAGDRFIFKGGVTWDSTNWRMQPTSGGTTGTYDYYGVDKTWYTGSSWTRPVFDGASAPILPNGHMIQLEAGWIEFDNIEMRNITSATGAQFIAVDAVSNILVTNCWLHGANQKTFSISSISRSSSGVISVVTSSPTNFTGTGTVSGCPLNCAVIYGVTGDTSVNTYCGNQCARSSPSANLFPISAFTDNQHFSIATTNSTASGSTSGGTIMNSDGYILFLSSGGAPANLVLDNSIVSNAEYSTTQNYGEVLYGWTTVQYSLIHDIGSVSSGIRSFHDSEVYDVSWPIATFDAGQHTDGAYLAFQEAAYNNWVYNYNANETFFYVNPEGDNSTCTPNAAYIYNNVFMQGTGPGTISPFVDINDYPGVAACDTVYILNNTFEMAGTPNTFRLVGRSTNGLTTTYFENNHIITNTAAVAYSCGPGCGTFTNMDQIWQTVTTANGQGYTGGNNWSPTFASNSTVGAGTNLTSMCSGLLAALCSTTTLGNTISAAARPSSGAWDVGAYMFSSTTSPPTGISVVTQ